MPRLLLVLSVVLLALAPAARADHDTPYQHGETEAPALNPALSAVKTPSFEGGPCTGEYRKAFPAAPGHDHLNIKQHDFSCRMKGVFFDPLTETLPREDLVLGEMDVKGNLMVIGVAFPESGFLLYDISDPAKPKFLSHYRGAECESLIVDVDCGAYVDLSPDLQRVYVSIQQTTVLPTPSANLRPGLTVPGVDVVDISEPTLPVLRQSLPVSADGGGVHTTKSFVVPEGPDNGPREPGEYTVSIANGAGLQIAHWNGTLLEPVPGADGLVTIPLAESHDTWIMDDPILNRTLLYVAGGFNSGFFVFDITAPTEPKLLGEWDLTPECPDDFYAHTIDVSIRGGKRILTMPNEYIDFFGEQGDPNCGKFKGVGELAGTMWFVDVTDFSKLGPADTQGQGENTEDESAKLKQASLDTLVTYWSNPAGRPGGELTFSPHNQQIVGDKVYLSHYHAGVVVLDAKEALQGKNVRPKELAFKVPTGEPVRPIHPDVGGRFPNLPVHFVTGFIDYRPLIWDMFYVNGHVMVPDMVGGLHVLREDDAPPPVVSGSGPRTQPGCADTAAPRSRFRRVRLSRRRGVSLRGSAADKGCGRVANVAVAVARKTGKRCSWLSSFGRFEKARSCRKPIFLTAKGTTNWSYAAKLRLRKGTYVVQVRGTDAAGNRERPRTAPRRSSRVR